MALLADEAFYEQDYLKAKTFYKKAIRLNRKVHEFYFGLAKVYYKTNELTLAKNAMKRAIHLNRITSTQAQYVAKLSFLNHLNDQSQ
jgi:Tfp pilus assembly protein PilF